MSDQFVGEIRTVSYNFAPAGWALCNGQQLPISQYTALFSLLGTTYGGDGRTTFALPDLQGMSPLAPGQGPGLTSMAPGQSGGTQTVTLTQAQLPAHNHTVGVVNDAGTQDSPKLAALAEALRGRFGRTHPAMRILGIGKGSRRRPTAATRAAAVTRRQARAARGSRSKKRTP